MSRMNELGDQTVTWEIMMKAQKIFHGQMLTEVLREMELADRERQALEDTRANKRNFNRMMTLLGALLIGLVVTWTLSRGMVPHGKAIAPYAFTITILLDSSLALYSYIRRY